MFTPPFGNRFVKKSSAPDAAPNPVIEEPVGGPPACLNAGPSVGGAFCDFLGCMAGGSSSLPPEEALHKAFSLVTTTNGDQSRQQKTNLLAGASIRFAIIQDVPGLVELEYFWHNKGLTSEEKKLRRHMRNYPKGQLVAVVSSQGFQAARETKASGQAGPQRRGSGFVAAELLKTVAECKAIVIDWIDPMSAIADGTSDAETKRMGFMEFGIDSFDAQKLALNPPLRAEHDAMHGTVTVRVRGSGASGVSDNSSTVKV